MRTFLIVFFMVVQAFAQELSLQEIYAHAREKAESIALQEVQVLYSKERLKKLESAFYPQIFFQVDYTRLDASNLPSASSGVTRIFDPNQYAVRFGANILNIQGWREYYGHKAAKLDLESQKTLVEQTQRNLYAQVAQAYFNVLAAKKDLENLERYYRANLTQGNNIQALVRLGRVNPSDLLTQQANVANAQTSVVQAKATINLALNTLRAIAGLDDKVIPKDDKSPLPLALREREYYLSAIDLRADVKSFNAAVAATEANIRVAQGGYGPTLDVFGNVYPIRSGALSGAIYDVGLSFNFPLFEGLGTMSDVRMAKTRKQEVLLQRAQAKRNALLEIHNAYDQIEITMKPLESIKAAMKAAQKDYQQRLSDYKQKLISNLELNQSLNLMIAAQRTYDQSYYGAKAALHVLHAATGNIP